MTSITEFNASASNALPATAQHGFAHAQPNTDVDYDVLIVGAGLSGIAAAYHLRDRLPSTRFAILESRSSLGGTWDLFRYPGIRSDSDMYTLGFSFRPWQGDKAIADGQSILDYVKDTTREFGIDKTIQFEHKVIGADWDSSLARWSVQVERSADGHVERRRYTCSFLHMCSGYYDYDQGHAPQWPGMDQFAGQIVHPQQWPAGLAYADKRVVVVGSGATAVTLVPTMAVTAKHVTMLQRSPTYIFALPSRDVIADKLRGWFPSTIAHRLVRTKNVLLSMYLYNYARRKPEAAKKAILKMAAKQLGPDFDIGKHLTPRYKPWDQRLCIVPNGDLFKAIRAGKASIVTDEIESFTSTGLRLRSGELLDADIIVTATGLKLKLLGGANITVDGRPINLGDTVSYKGMMSSGVPNLASTFGYTNASWTLKAELVAKYVARLLQHMQTNGYDTCVPVLDNQDVGTQPAVDLTSGYIQRAAASLPRQGLHKPWIYHQNYAFDLAAFRFGKLEDGAMRFERRKVAQPAGSDAAYVAEEQTPAKTRASL
ncbi:NAD(P)/FAD-dependent oxidoreductase [Rhodanobacter sp. MP1X3]|uniref:flavin-containing monooxygenase n=1 Tax=Rhodanobacter sp. MP1X3 TaxID=2723086 RepID=UPI0016084B34|nr:NAD(P)/FAD-dependent oxidoreductase [Rhodanobacter sp. MP1X3]MBB6242088.1 cation diffusion facilitator CzcD-associated flavoprotein CzcO [Rhodanobacter sp. MP1X3]